MDRRADPVDEGNAPVNDHRSPSARRRTSTISLERSLSETQRLQAERARRDQNSTPRPPLPLPPPHDHRSDSEVQDSPSDLGPPPLPRPSDDEPSSSYTPMARFLQERGKGELISLGINTGNRLPGGLSMSSSGSPALDRPPFWTIDQRPVVESPQRGDFNPAGPSAHRPGFTQVSNTSEGSLSTPQASAAPAEPTSVAWSTAADGEPDAGAEEDEVMDDAGGNGNGDSSVLDPGLNPRSYTRSRTSDSRDSAAHSRRVRRRHGSSPRDGSGPA